jgi:subtilisin family serine protease
VDSGIHGFACAEIVRDIAPDVELHLVRVNGFTMFENAARWAIRNDIDIISMSMSFYNDSFYDGNGPFDAVIAQLEANDILVVTSAGNNARLHWRGTFSDADGDGRMDFDGSNGLDIEIPSGGGNLYVNWNQHGRCGDTDLDVYVYDADRNIVGNSVDEQIADAEHCQPVERVSAHSESGGAYRLEVHHQTGLSSYVEVDILLRSGAIKEAVPEGSVADPAAHVDVFAVGAVRASKYFSGDVEGFSSWGPANSGVAKPDIAGPDGLSTDAYGPVGFFGTSASTPVVAALIAVILSDDPSLTPREAAHKLQGWALSEGLAIAEPDPRWGAGKARLPIRNPETPPCGRRPLVMWLIVLPVWWFRKRVRKGAHLR